MIISLVKRVNGWHSHSYSAHCINERKYHRIIAYWKSVVYMFIHFVWSGRNVRKAILYFEQAAGSKDPNNEFKPYLHFTIWNDVILLCALSRFILSSRASMHIYVHIHCTEWKEYRKYLKERKKKTVENNLFYKNTRKSDQICEQFSSDLTMQQQKNLSLCVFDLQIFSCEIAFDLHV